MDSRRDTQGSHCLKEIQRSVDVRAEGLARRMPGHWHEALRGKVEDVVRCRLLQEVAHRTGVTQVALEKVDAVADVVNALCVAPPADRAPEVDAILLQQIFCQMASHEAGNPCD